MSNSRARKLTVPMPFVSAADWMNGFCPLYSVSFSGSPNPMPSVSFTTELSASFGEKLRAMERPAGQSVRYANGPAPPSPSQPSVCTFHPNQDRRLSAGSL